MYREKPTVIAITETWMDEAYKLELEGYVIYRNDRNEDGGGVMLAIRKEIKNITVEVKRTKESVESLWILINNTKIKIRIGVMYLPQEADQNLKEIHRIIKEQARECGEKSQSLIIVGDFNCRIGSKIPGNAPKVSKGGKKLLKTVEKEGLEIVNGMAQCEGLWTREENGDKSVIDYVIVDEELGSYVDKMKILGGGDRTISPFNLKRTGKEIKMVYSDHNPIVIETDLVLKQTSIEDNKKRMVMTDDGKVKYRNELKELEVSKIWDNVDDIQEVYSKWCKEVERVKGKYMEKRNTSKKRRSKTMRLLMTEKKKIKERLKRGFDNNENDMVRLHELKEQIMNEEKDTYYRRLKKNCEEIKINGKFNSAGFWKVRKRMERKKEEESYAVRNMKGELVTTNDGILQAYGEYYKDLLTTTNKRTTLPGNRAIVEKVEEKFNKIMEEAEKQAPSKTNRETVAEVIKSLKKNKAPDKEGWKNEMLIDGGEEIIDSIVKMTNCVLEKFEVPTPWNHMTIKSVHKKGEREDLSNKRGLFLTNIVSKVFEKIISKENPVLYDSNQNGGTKKRGTVDTWMLLRAVIDEGRRLKKPVYLFFADLVKCFDRLWLKDCINDLRDCGMRERELGIVYKLNEEAKFTVSTPSGTTNEMEVKEIVKQGTVFGPKLCCGSTGKINENLDVEEVVYPTVAVKATTYVDDIKAGGGRRFVKAVMENCRRKEDEKLWEFSTEKSNWMCIANRRKVENIDVEVKQGKIERTKVYKYVGNMINEKGNLDDQLVYMEGKIGGIIREGKKMCCSSRIGKAEIEAKRLVYEVLAETSVYYNIEAWTNLRVSDVQMIKTLQAKILKGLFGLPKTTPYWGLIHELGVMPIISRVTYKKLMLYHNIVNSDDSRVAKKLVLEQERRGIVECWFGEVKREAKEIGIMLGREQVQGKPKSAWKREVKEKVGESVKKKLLEQKKESKKLRFLEVEGHQTYLNEVHNDDARMAIKIRLNMVEWIESNYGKETKCPLCKEEKDTTEHVFSCEQMKDENNGVCVRNLEKGEKMMEIVELFRKNEDKRKTLLLEEAQLNLRLNETV